MAHLVFRYLCVNISLFSHLKPCYYGEGTDFPPTNLLFSKYTIKSVIFRKEKQIVAFTRERTERKT